MTPYGGLVVLSLWGLISGERGKWLEHGEFKFYISSGGRTTTYQKAKNECRNLNAILATIDTNETHVFLASKISSSSGQPYAFYIGLHDESKEGTYKWEDGSNPVWTNWNSGEPNNHDTENCATFGSEPSQYRPAFLWNNGDCQPRGNRPGFICRKERNEQFTYISTTISTNDITTLAESKLTEKAVKPYVERTTHLAEAGNFTKHIVTPESDLTPVIIGAVFGAILLIGLIIALIYRRRLMNSCLAQKNRPSTNVKQKEPGDIQNSSDLMRYPSPVVNENLPCDFNERSDGVHQNTIRDVQSRANSSNTQINQPSTSTAADGSLYTVVVAKNKLRMNDHGHKTTNRDESEADQVPYVDQNSSMINAYGSLQTPPNHDYAETDEDLYNTLRHGH